MCEEDGMENNAGKKNPNTDNIIRREDTEGRAGGGKGERTIMRRRNKDTQKENE